MAYPVSIPQECVELAQREGVPVVIASRYEAVKARIKLSRLKDEPMVRECRAAVARAKQAMAAMVATPPATPTVARNE